MQCEVIDLAYSTKDIVLIAGLSVISGIIFAITSDVLATPVEVIGGHYGIAVIYGLWFIGGTLTGYVVRKPWAAFLGETIGAIIELLALSPYSILLYYYGPAQGIMSELAFAIFRYKKWDYTSMFLAGALPAIAAYPFDVLVSPFYPEAVHYTLVTHVTLFMGYLLSGAILGGFLVKFIVDAAVKAGAIKL
jgi:energy-coupling factor transport system substrate-specific component